MESSLHILLYRAFHAQRNYLRPSLQALGLGTGQPKLLAYLEANGPCHQRQLADYFDVDPATISRMMESLQAGGFISRRTDEQNHRRDLVQVTDRGRQASAEWRAHCRQAQEIMLQGFTDQERAQFADYLARAYGNMQEELGRKAP